MNSRENILAAIKASKPVGVPLPEFSFAKDEGGSTERFINILTSIGGQCKLVNDNSFINQHIEDLKRDEKFIIQCIQEFDFYNGDEYINAQANDIQLVDTVFLRGGIALAENGAIWVSEKNMVNRLLPFLCQHLVLVIYEKDIVPTMHHAYANIHVDEDGFGAFIAGPSKTADIEQSLVIGAHGPLSLMVYIVS